MMLHVLYYPKLSSQIYRLWPSPTFKCLVNLALMRRRQWAGNFEPSISSLLQNCLGERVKKQYTGCSIILTRLAVLT